MIEIGAHFANRLRFRAVLPGRFDCVFSVRHVPVDTTVVENVVA